jgi:hypothetical protein
MHLPEAKLANDGVALVGGPVGVHHVHVDPVQDQLGVQLLRALLALHKDEHRRLEAGLHQLPKRQQLPLFLPHEREPLLDGGGARVGEPHGHVQRVAEHRRDELSHLVAHGRRKERALPAGVARPQNLVDLRQEAVVFRVAALVRAELKQPVRFVEHHQLHAAQLQAPAAQRCEQAHRRADQSAAEALAAAPALRRGGPGLGQKLHCDAPARREHRRLAVDLRGELARGR